MENVCVVLSPSDVRRINEQIRRIESMARQLQDVAGCIDAAAEDGGMIGAGVFDRSRFILSETESLGHRFRSAVFQKKQREGEQGEIGSGSRR